MTISTHYEEAKRRYDHAELIVQMPQAGELVEVEALAELESALADMLYHVRVKRQHLQQQPLAQAGVGGK